VVAGVTSAPATDEEASVVVQNNRRQDCNGGVSPPPPPTSLPPTTTTTLSSNQLYSTATPTAQLFYILLGLFKLLVTAYQQDYNYVAKGTV